MLKTLDLFSGIGGFHYAAQLTGGFETTQFVEIDPHARTVLQHYPSIPIHDDITTYHANPGKFDVIVAGFPCQDISAAGTQAGLDGCRSGLFFEIIRLIRECRPRYVLLENVAALTTSNRGRDMGTVLWELSECGYDAEWQIIPAAAVGANHIRQRIWLVAYPNRKRRQRTDSIESNMDKQRHDQACCQKRKAVLHSINTGFSFPWPPRLSDISTVPVLDDGIPAGLPRCGTHTARG